MMLLVADLLGLGAGFAIIAAFFERPFTDVVSGLVVS